MNPRYFPTIRLGWYWSITLPTFNGWFLIKSAKNKAFSERNNLRGKNLDFAGLTARYVKLQREALADSEQREKE
jgi:hypothetical protein